MIELTLKSYLRIWLERSLGEPEIFEVRVTGSFVSGNTINAIFDGVAMAQVTYATSQANTMELFRRALENHPAIFKAELITSSIIRCTGLLTGHTLVIVGPTVTGGASQPTITTTVTQTPVSVPVIYADQNAPRPAEPYSVLRLDSFIKLHQDEIRYVNPNSNLAQIGGLRRATVGVHYFGPNPLQEITKAYNSLSKVTIKDFLYSGGIAIIERNAVQNLTAMLETRFEQHTFFDMLICYAENFEDDLGRIQSAEFTGVYEDGVDGTITEAPVRVAPPIA